MLYAQTKICPREGNAENSLGFLDTNGSPNLSQKTRPRDNFKKIGSSCIVDFAVSADHRVEMKETKMRDKYSDLAWELRKLRNMRVKMLLIIICRLGSFPKGLERELFQELEIGGRIETIQTTALLRTTRILRRVLETWGNLLSLTPTKDDQLTLVRRIRKGWLYGCCDAHSD